MSPDPSGDEFLKRIEALETRFRDMQDDIAFGWARKAGEELTVRVSSLPAAVQQLRARGYAFKNFLERKAEVLAKQWTDLRPRLMESMEAQSRDLRYRADLFQQRLPFLRYNRSEVELSAAEAALKDLEARVQTAGNAIKDLAKTVEENVRQTVDQLKELDWVVDQAEGAAFKLNPGESIVSAVKGQWLTSEKEGPRGVLYLTDERILFERKEDIVTKKVLFIAKEKQKVQQLEWNAAFGRIEAVQASEKGGAILGIGKKEILEFRFSGGVKVDAAALRIEADSSAWQTLIGRAKSGDIAGERAFPKGQAAAPAAPAAAALKCAVCGAEFPAAIRPGAAEIKCAYCGTIVRL